MPRDTKYLFKILKGLDRTVENTQGLNPVVFSTELNNIISSTYTNNRESFSNVAVVAGEGEGSSRVHYSVNPTEQGYSRRELYVDARDLQSSYYDSATSQTVTLPQAEYEKLLLERGKEKLKDVAEVESFEGKLRNDDGSMFIYKRDYFKGVIVTVIDRLLNVKLSARVTAVTITNDRNGYTVEPTFGYSQPTIIQRLKRKGVF
jgi:hypothetical protein